MNIIYVGPLNYGGICLQRKNCLDKLGHKVVEVDTLPIYNNSRGGRVAHRILSKLFGPYDYAGANRKITTVFSKNPAGPVDLVWIDKGLTITPQTLILIKKLSPKTLIAGYSPDDMAGRNNQSKCFLAALPYYDIYFTTKSYGVSELTDLGCRRVEFIDNAFDPDTHTPMQITEGDRARLGGPVGFIGTYEKERGRSLLFLAQAGIRVRIWGDNWPRLFHHRNLTVERRFISGTEYAKALCSFDVNLAFLRKVSRDLQTTRSVEIPACGGFMLAERTNEHLRLFDEGKEAMFFSSDDELLATELRISNGIYDTLAICDPMEARKLWRSADGVPSIC